MKVLNGTGVLSDVLYLCKIGGKCILRPWSMSIHLYHVTEQNLSPRAVY